MDSAPLGRHKPFPFRPPKNSRLLIRLAKWLLPLILRTGVKVTAVEISEEDLLHLRFLRTAKRHWFSFCMADSTGKDLAYGEALAGSLLLARRIGSDCPNQTMVGLLLPASVGGALANIAALLAGKVPVNLNFTAGPEAMTSAIRQCGIRTILTSRTFLAKAKLEEREGMVFLEDALAQVKPWQKVGAALCAFLLPSRILQRLCARGPTDPHQLATVVFSSGSTGTPKGVMLSHHNILSNIEAALQVFRLTRNDCMMGVLPFFHCFGFTHTLWLPLVSGFAAVYHPNPLDARTVGKMTAKHKATLLVATPTFYTAYLRKCSPEEFASLRLAIVGAEKLPEPLAKAFREKFHLDLLEGYGCTEMAPVITANSPDVAEGVVRQIGHKPGTAGRPLPGIAVKVVDWETGQPLGRNQEGMLLVQGPNQMMGYLGQPEKTAEVLRDGWYVTGDIASLDEDGFIRIADRLARFSKIGGEMVPHGKIEEVLLPMGEGDASCAVTTIPDEQKGERLVVFYTHKNVSAKDLWERLCRSDLPRLWVPKPENFYYLETLPTLGTGKVDLKQLKSLARQLASPTGHTNPGSG